MTREELRDAILGGEGPSLAFERSFSKSLGRELCAFANASGGSLFVGVSDDGAVVGVSHHTRLKSRIRDIARSADPPIRVEIDAIGEVLRVDVPAQHDKPYSFGGRFFRRVGANSHRMSVTEIEEMFYEVGRLHFDSTPCPNIELEKDLNDATWDGFSRRAKIPRAMDRRAALRNLGLVNADQRMTHAGAWLKARDIRTVTTSAHVSCKLFLGRTKFRILERRDFHRHMAGLVDDVTFWILTKINVEFIIKHVRREERPELPEDALREAVANAVAHRDYRSPANVQVYVFKDRVEIVSPGGLPVGMTKADLGTKSVPRNPLLFDMLYRMDVVERIGSGVRRMFDLCRHHGTPLPRIDVSEHWVTVTFPRPPQVGAAHN
ncbi:MAG: putative DNA binding domain-containing protein [Bryobacterales bacterium]|nr:putative DNA binding domain-containing protein [Bryobacterales bacterium]